MGLITGGGGRGGGGGRPGRSGGVCTGTGGLGAGGIGGAGPGPGPEPKPGQALGEPGPSRDRQGRPDTVAGLGGPDRERGREEPRGPGGSRAGPSPGERRRWAPGWGVHDWGPGWDAGQGHWTGRRCLWRGCGVGDGESGGLIPHDAQQAAPAGGPRHSPGLRLCYLTGGEGNWANWGVSVSAGGLGLCPTPHPCHQGKLGPGAR